jgi:hypothetical protein
MEAPSTMTIPASRRAILSAAAVVGLGLGSAFGVSAQSTPEAMAPAVACAEALGIGEAGSACVNVVHASPDAPAVDVYVNDEVAIPALAFGTASGFVALPAGDYNVKVAPAGTSAEEAVIDADVTLDADVAYEVAAVGLVADIAPAIFPVDLSSLESTEESSVRVIHASPDAPAVDVAVTGGDVLVENLEFPNASDYLVIPAGSYDLEVRPTGTEDVALALAGTEIPAGAAISVYAIGTLADGTLAALPVVAAPMAMDAEATPGA